MYRFKDWQNHWQNLDVPWAGDTSNDKLFEFIDGVEDEFRTLEKSAFIPLAGDTPAVRRLYEYGFSVTAVEFVPEAVREMRVKQFPELSFSEENVRNGKKFSAERVSLYLENIFEFETNTRFSLIFDRAAYVALGESERARYAEILLRNLAPKGFLVIRTAELIGGEWDGPPFSIKADEVRKAFQSLSLVKEEAESITPNQERYLEAGVKDFRYSTFLFRKNS